jgi:undecaprenyl-diphosphatase
MEGFSTLVTSSDLNSFPSGHTCAAFAFGVALCAVLPQKWAKAAALIAAALMGFSRLYVGVHFPSDVIVGALVGALCGLVGTWIVTRFVTWYQSRQSAE